jgi:phosphoglycolate phosphatase
MSPRPLAVFDVDGTLVDSRSTIQSAIEHGFRRAGREPPAYDQIRQIVGLSLAPALAQLAPHLSEAEKAELVEGYREHFWTRHQDPAFKEPLYPGAAETLDRLRHDGWLIAMATGKSRRGVETVMRKHGWADLFDSTHCADDGPGKPDPAMLIEAMRVLKTRPEAAIMIGDTAHDIRMAKAAGVFAQGVAWGFHTAEEVAEAGADHVAETFTELDQQLDRFAARLKAA